MNRKSFQNVLLSGLALAAFSTNDTQAADRSPNPFRLANARKLQDSLEKSTLPPVEPLPSKLEALPESAPANKPGLPPMPMGQSYPAQPKPDPTLEPEPKTRTTPRPMRNPNGGANYTGPLGADYVPAEKPKQMFLGDGTLSESSNHPKGMPYGLSTFDPVTGTMTPPPGTLGHTYRVRSREQEPDKHPRVGVVEVQLSEQYEVSAMGLKTKWTGKVWRLESDPLMPGVPHIYHVKAEWGPDEAKNVQVRTIRLIPDRIVDLKF